MTTLETPYAVASLSESLGRLGRLPRPPFVGPRPGRHTTSPIDQQPAAVAFPKDERDVQAIVRYAAEHGLRVAAQRTGHNARAARLARRRTIRSRPTGSTTVEDRSRRPPCARGIGRQVGVRRPARVRPRHGRPPRVDAGRLDRRLRPRRRRRLVRPQARPVHKQHHRDRARDRRRRPAPRRRTSTSPSRSGRCAAAAAASGS